MLSEVSVTAEPRAFPITVFRQKPSLLDLFAARTGSRCRPTDHHTGRQVPTMSEWNEVDNSPVTRAIAAGSIHGFDE